MVRVVFALLVFTAVAAGAQTAVVDSLVDETASAEDVEFALDDALWSLYQRSATNRLVADFSARFPGAYRPSASGRVTVPGGVVGIRVTEFGNAGFLTVGRGWLRDAVVGDFRLKFGEGLVFGGTSSSYASVSSKRAPRPLITVPSLSLWRRARGASLTVADGPVVLSGATWRDRSGAAHVGSATVVGAGASVSVLAARRGQVGIVDALSLAASGAIDGVGLASEVATINGQMVASIRCVIESPWRSAIRIRFGEPTHGFFGQGGSGVRHDVAGSVEGRAGAIRQRFRFVAGVRDESGEAVRRSRLEWNASSSVGAEDSWMVGMRLTDSQQEIIPTRAIDHDVVTTFDREVRLRLGWSFRRNLQTARFRFQPRVTWYFDPLTSTLMSWRTSVDYRWISATIVVSAFDMAPASRVYVTRPAIGGYDVVYAVSRRGSDFSGRLRMRVLSAGAIWMSFAQEVGKRQRVTLGASIRL